MEISELKDLRRWSRNWPSSNGIVADLTLQNRVLKDVIEKKALRPCREAELVEAQVQIQGSESAAGLARIFNISSSVYCYQRSNGRMIVQVMTRLVGMAEKWPTWGFLEAENHRLRLEN